MAIHPWIRKRASLPWAAVLVAVVLRSLVPQGYMPVVQDGRLTIAVCDGIAHAPARATSDSSAHSHHHHGAMSDMAPVAAPAMPGSAHPGDGGPAGAGHGHPPCLFAVSALPAPPLAVPMAISGDDHVVVTPDYPPPVGAAVAIERAQSPRAPPALA